MKNFRAFTLAEVLITLMIIGVVAAVTIPTLMNNINNNAMANQRKTVSAKIAEGFSQMRVAGGLGENYTDTMAFVNEMKKYFKINAVCKSTELTNCFNSTVTSVNGEETNEIANMDGVDDVVGLILSDGTSMLIKYDKTADKIEEGQIEKVGYINDAKGSLQYATYGDLIKYVYDVNGSKSPNKSGTDIMGNLSIAPGEPSYSNDNCVDIDGSEYITVSCSDLSPGSSACNVLTIGDTFCPKACGYICDENHVAVAKPDGGTLCYSIITLEDNGFCTENSDCNSKCTKGCVGATSTSGGTCQ